MSDRVRLDRWLWAVRLFKTRPLAQAAISHGNVRVNGQPAKASRALAVGDVVAYEKLGIRDEVGVLGLLDTRVSAAAAQQAYARTQDGERVRTADLEKRRTLALANRPVAPDTRPGKHGREQLRRIKRGDT